MIECSKYKDRMIEAYYGELEPGDREELDRHVASCPECAAELASLRSTLGLMDGRERTDPGAEFWDGYWDRLSRRMLWESIDEDRKPSLVRRFVRSLAALPRWSYQAAGAAALLLIGIFIGGRLIAPPGGPVRETAASVAAGSVDARAAAVVQAGNFVERSKVILLGLVNSGPAGADTYGLDLDGKKAMSRNLAAEAPALRRALTGRDQKRLRDLVAELEVIMMQIANLGSGQDVEGVELVKQGVDARGIFLKIDLDRMGRDARPAVTVPGAPGTVKISKT
ncbi:MAG: hypothetical protein H6P96_737 [Candidatus Aminicenantes bacterium]|nr:hypothetical protein [Candidatus Aminicenantes bacterium]